VCGKRQNGAGVISTLRSVVLPETTPNKQSQS
jgi:hypothetical protein